MSNTVAPVNNPPANQGEVNSPANQAELAVIAFEHRQQGWPQGTLSDPDPDPPPHAQPLRLPGVLFLPAVWKLVHFVPLMQGHRVRSNRVGPWEELRFHFVDYTDPVDVVLSPACQELLETTQRGNACLLKIFHVVMTVFREHGGANNLFQEVITPLADADGTSPRREVTRQVHGAFEHVAQEGTPAHTIQMDLLDELGDGALLREAESLGSYLQNSISHVRLELGLWTWVVLDYANDLRRVLGWFRTRHGRRERRDAAWEDALSVWNAQH